MRPGTIKQLKGPFQYGKTYEFGGDKVKIGISLDMKDLLPFNQYEDGFNFTFKIPNVSNETLIKMGKTGMYETDTPIALSWLRFNQPPEDTTHAETPESVIINYVVY